MNPQTYSTTTSGLEKKNDHAKLISLLALATGAVAMPQSSNADIIFTDLSASPINIGPNADPNYTISNLPGTARFAFVAHSVPTAVSTSHFIIAGQNAGYIRVKTLNSFALPVAKSVTWGQIAMNVYRTGVMGFANAFSHFPNSYDHQYIAFLFRDSTQANAIRYGWIELSLSNPPSGNGPNVLLFGYAFDTTGAQIPMGAVPEPSSMSLLALGALALGAKGVRSWRRNRAANS